MIPGFSKETFLPNGAVSASRKWISGSGKEHWHDFYEIEYIISGSGDYVIDGKSFPIESGMLYFMTPIDFHNVHTDRSQIINVMFSESILTPAHLVPFSCQAAPKAFPIPEEMRPFIMTLLEEIVQYQEQPVYCAALLDCLLLKLAHQLLPLEESSWNQTAQKIHYYIINHFREKVTLEDVAQYVGLTPAYVSAVFKKEMNINFKKYLNELRFTYARKLLQYSDMSVTQICGECGFDDYPNFIRRFKEHFGITPSQMRMNICDAPAQLL